MKLLPKILMFFMVLTLVGGGVYYYYVVLTPEKVVKAIPQKIKKGSIGSLEAIEQAVKHRKSGSVKWVQVRNGHRLFAKDKVSTQKDAKVDFVFNRRAILELLSNSTVQVDEKNGTPHIKLEKGIAYAKLGSSNPKLYLDLLGRELLLSSQNAVVQMHTKSSGEPDVFVISGNLSVTEEKKKIKLEPGQKIKFGDGVGRISIHPEFISIEKPPLDSKINLSFSTPVVFEWASNIRVNPDYQVEFSEDSSFQESYVEKNINKDILRYDRFKKKKYFWRVVSNNSGSKVTSPILYFEVVNIEVPKISTNNQVINTSKKAERKFDFTWEGGASWQYEIEIVERNTKKKELFKTTSNLFTWKATKPNGDFEWRVRGLTPLTEWSLPGIFKTSYGPFLTKFSPDDQYISPMNLRKDYLFAWEGVAKDSYEIEISPDQNFNKIIYKKQVEGNTHYVSLRSEDLQTEELFWRIKAMDFPDYPSKINKIYLTKPVAKLISPLNQRVTTKYFQERISFKWNIIKDIPMKDVMFEVSESDKFDKSIKVPLTESNREGYHHLFNDSKMYFWRLIYNGDNKRIASTDYYFVNLYIPLPLSSPKIYKHYDLKYYTLNGKPFYPISWEKISDATSYLIEIFKDEQMSELHKSERVNSNHYYWFGKTSGQFFYRIKAFGDKGRFSKYSSLGKLIFPISPLQN